MVNTKIAAETKKWSDTQRPFEAINFVSLSLIIFISEMSFFKLFKK